MSRIRSVHPGFFTDEELVEVSFPARLLLIGLGVEADDGGIFPWKPTTMKMRIFPADNVDVPALLAELISANAVRQYEADGKQYGAIRNFRKHQRPKSPKLTHPTTPTIRTYTGLEEPVSEPTGDKPDAIPPNGEMNGVKVEALPPNGEISPQMEDGEEDGEELTSSDEDVGESGDSLTPPMVLEYWNEVACRIGRPMARGLDKPPNRRKQIKSRIAQYSIDDFVTVFRNVEGNDFLRGDTDRWKGVDLDWIMKAGNFHKILEGNYQ